MSRINLAGKINTFCFDKTGTLTEEGLETFGIRVINQSKLENSMHLFLFFINNIFKKK